MASDSTPPLSTANDAPFFTLSLTAPQATLLNLLTPFRFRPAPGHTSISPSTPSPVEPYLPLSAPPATPFALILTPARPSDIPRQLSCLNDPRVGLSLVGPPYPYAESDARLFGQGKGAETTEYFPELLKAAEELVERYGEEGAVERKEELPRPRGGCPFGTIRREENDEWVGDLGVMRWTFEDVEGEEERDRLAKENAEKTAGDPSLAWSFGFFLHPSYHGLRLMTPLLTSHLSYFKSFLRCTRIHGAAFESNVASLKAQERNGLVRYNTWTRKVSEARGGGEAVVVVLKWEKGDEREGEGNK